LIFLTTVTEIEMRGLTGFIDLFSGIGGFSLGAYRAGIRTDRHYFSEVNDYAIKVYTQRFPDAIPLGDIRKINWKETVPNGDYIVCGGFPCQPHSLAGKRKAGDDERDLWPECARMLRELRPAVALFENVPGLFTSDRGEFFNGVLSDISSGGYDAEWQIISAADVGAPHKRDRVWIICHPIGGGRGGFPRGRSGAESADGYLQLETRDNVANAENKRCKGNGSDWKQEPISGYQTAQFERVCLPISASTGLSDRARETGQPSGASNESQRCDCWAVEPGVGRVAHGVPHRVDRLKGLGNAIVPENAELIFWLAVFDRWRINLKKVQGENNEV
jgi:DNA (cytosine-5)-methyltransferase 1